MRVHFKNNLKPKDKIIEEEKKIKKKKQNTTTKNNNKNLKVNVNEHVSDN